MKRQTTTTLPIFKTPYRVEKEAKELAIYNDYKELMSLHGQSATAVTDHLMQKYGIHSASTIYEIRKRVAARLEKEGATL